MDAGWSLCLSVHSSNPSHLLPNISSPKRTARIFRKMRVKIFSAFLNKLPDSYTNGQRRQRARKRKENKDEMLKKKIILLSSSPYSICIFSILLFLSIHWNFHLAENLSGQSWFWRWKRSNLLTNNRVIKHLWNGLLLVVDFTWDERNGFLRKKNKKTFCLSAHSYLSCFKCQGNKGGLTNKCLPLDINRPDINRQAQFKNESRTIRLLLSTFPRK